MISVNRRTLYGEVFNDVRCLSSDEKPTDGIKNGSTLIEIDTGKRYLYDALSGSWNEFSQGGGGGGGGSYVLPTMSPTTKGGATVGDGLTMDGTALSVDYSKVASKQSLDDATKVDPDGGLKRTTDGLSADYSKVASVESLESATKLEADGGIKRTSNGLSIDYSEVASVDALDTKAPAIINTASGEIASFDDGADGMPIKKLVANIEPVQDLHGYDHPWPAGGGKNLFDPQKVVDAGGTFDGTKYSATQGVLQNTSLGYIQFAENTQYYFYAFGKVNSTNNAGAMRIKITYTDSTTEYKTVLTDDSEAAHDAYSNANKSISSIGFSAYGTLNTDTNYFTKFMICKASNGTTYEPYSNICPISGWTGAEIEHTGINIWDEEWRNGYYNEATGEFVPNTAYVANKNPVPALPRTTYYGVESSTYIDDILCYDTDMNYLGVATKYSDGTRVTKTNTAYINFRARQAYSGIYNHDISINYPATDTDYHPYIGNQISITFPSEVSTVYGGTLDVTTGLLTVDMAMVDLGTLNYSYSTAYKIFNAVKGDIKAHGMCISSQYKYDINIDAPDMSCFLGFEGWFVDRIAIKDSRYTDTATFKAAMSGVQLVYELATPIEYQLTPQEVTTLLGTNNIWADTGDVEVAYPADTKLYIDGINQPTDDDMTADTQIASGKYFIIGNALYKSTKVIPAGDTIIPGTNCIKTNLAEALNALNA